ncbi:MAG: 4-hydroxy-tetrahydrodipicolinate synthase [Phycisphaeraceae bacterium]|nr:4-hydroxy-tetrahydrodipicolinate synthase [Phycisphaeraceae bacterium]
MPRPTPLPEPKAQPVRPLQGCFTAIVTPFTEDGRQVDVDRLKRQILAQAEGGVAGIVPCGTTGESPTLTEEEHATVVELAVREGHARGLTVIAGAGSNSTAHALHLHKLAHRLGADASLQVSPYYNKPSQEGLYRHFMTIADGTPLPIVLYNIPGRCGVAIAPETIERLATHPNIVAVKEATGSMDSASEIRQRCGITILSGDDSLTLSFAAIGSSGVVSVLSNLLPARVKALCDAFLSDRYADARRIHAELFPLARGLLSLDTNPIPLKRAMELLGRDSGVLRLPLCRMSESLVPRVRDLLQKAGLMADGGARMSGEAGATAVAPRGESKH